VGRKIVRGVCALAAVAAAFHPPTALRAVSAPGAYHGAVALGPTVPVLPLVHTRMCQRAAHMVQSDRPRRLSLPTVRESLKAIKHACSSLMVAVALTGGGGVVATRRAEAVAPVAPTTKVVTSKKRLNVGEQMITALVGCGGVTLWAKMVCDDEDREEAVRITKETEKLEELSKEFTDIDEGVFKDEDLFASLRSRMDNKTDTDEGGEGPSNDGGGGLPTPPRPAADSGGGAAVAEPPEPAAGEPGASPDDIARLKRMMG